MTAHHRAYHAAQQRAHAVLDRIVRAALAANVGLSDVAIGHLRDALGDLMRLGKQIEELIQGEEQRTCRANENT